MSATENNGQEFFDNDLDTRTSKPNTSRFFFLLFFFGIFIFAWAGCYNLYEHRYKPNTDVKVNESSLYSPKYK